MKKHGFLTLFLAAAHCGSDSGDSDAAAAWTLAARTTLEDFSLATNEVHAIANRGFLGSFVVQEAPGAVAQHQVRLVDMNGKTAYVHAYPFDAVSGRISPPDGDSIFLTEATDSSDPSNLQVRIRRMAVADGALQEYGVLPDPMLSLPGQGALHRGPDGRLWCLGVNSDSILTVYGLGGDGPTTKVPIATRLFLDFSSRIMPLRAGFAVVTRSAKLEPRFGVPAPNPGAEQAAVLVFDVAGNFVEAKTTTFESGVQIGAVRVDDVRIAIAGTVEHALNDESLFVRSWTHGPDARLTPEAEVRFDVGADQVQVTDLGVAPDGRWIAGGEVGLRQAETHSVIQGSRAFFATLSAAPAFALEQVATFGTPERRNSISALAPDPNGGSLGYAFVHHDFPKTHDADGRPDQAYSRMMLYQLQVWSQ